jgi:hypothetical protein
VNRIKCDRFEREGALSIERGERLSAHFSECPDCKAEHARYQRIIAALSFIDEPEERDSMLEERVLARVNAESTRRWPKLIPLSAFIGFVSFSRRAAAAPASKALCAITALTTILSPLPLVMGHGLGSGESPAALVATGVERPALDATLMSAGEELKVLRRDLRGRGPNSAEGQLSQSAAPSAEGAKSARQERRRARTAEPPAPSPRVEPIQAEGRRAGCAVDQCPNVVREMVINGLTGYKTAAQRRAGKQDG